MKLPFELPQAHAADKSPSSEVKMPVQETRTLSILLAEDSHVNAMFITKLLSKMGHSVAVVENGLEAVEKLKDGRFDCVLMDIQMPVMGGDEATRIIREGELKTGGDIPIIALTAHAMTEERERLLKEGFDAHVPKPVDIQALLGELKRLTRQGSKAIGVRDES